jgi:REP element-mobilizing transposase RayT
MRKARHLAPWHREAVGDDSLAGAEGREEEMGVLLAGMRGKAAIYHCVSRVVNRDFVLHREEREHFVRLMRIYEKFSQVRVLTFCVMTNHFHILVEVPAAPEDGGASWSDEDLLGHLEYLYSKREMAEIRWELEHFRTQKNGRAAEGLRQKYFDRMWDLSAFMKVLKQRFTQWFNRKHGREGYLWSGRFKSMLVEDGHAARTVAVYIDLNPVRAGIVADPKDYRWSGYGEAVAGKEAARHGLRLVLYEHLSAVAGEKRAGKEVASWREVARRYRVVLFEDGGERTGADGKRRRGISREEVARVLAEGGELSEAVLVRCKARHFIDGLVLGSEGFVNAVFEWSREYFGSARRSGARKLRGVRTELRTLRDLQRDAVST